MSVQMNPKAGPFTLEELDEKANTPTPKYVATYKGPARNEDAVPKTGMPYSFVDRENVKHQVYTHAEISCNKQVRGCVLIHDEAEVRGNLIPFPQSYSGNVWTDDWTVPIFAGLLLLVVILVYNVLAPMTTP